MKMSLLGLICAPLFAYATPPADVTGMAFTRREYKGSVHAHVTDRFFLRDGGTYFGLDTYVFRQGAITGATTVLIPVLSEVSIPPGGTWKYRVIDDATAELALDGKVLTLHFRDGLAAGHIGPVAQSPTVNLTTTVFELLPYNGAARMVNCSSRSYLSPGRSASLGFVIADGERRVLVRAVGSGLRTFGFPQPLDNLRLIVRDARFSALPVDAEIPPVSTTTLNIAAQNAGAFPLPSASDRAKFLILKPGAYVAEVTGIDNQSSGEVLIEVYQLL